MNDTPQYQVIVEEIFPDYIKDLKELISIRSHRDMNTSKEGAPFGEGIKTAFDFIAKRAQEMGLKVNDEDGYAMDIRTADGNDYIGVLCHIDTVEAIEMEKWSSNPYELTERNGNLYGRGVNDNKGPLLLSLYVIKTLKQLSKLELPVRLIIGGAEETTWECMKVYFDRNPQPIRAISPDGDFPIVNQEKGILKLELTLESKPASKECIQSIDSDKNEGFIASSGSIKFQKGGNSTLTGKKAMSRHPERGKNIVGSLMAELEKLPVADFYEEDHVLVTLLDFIKRENIANLTNKFNISNINNDDACSIALTHLNYKDGIVQIELDIRYTKACTEDEIIKLIKKKVERYKGKLKILDQKAPLFVPEDSYLIQTLLDVYESVIGERPDPLTKGGASYARVLNNGIAFGPTFPGESPRSHFENEYMRITSLKKAMQIYLLAVGKLSKKVNKGEIK